MQNLQKQSSFKLKVMDKPTGAPKRLKSDFQDNKCSYHFIWCPCNDTIMSKEIEKIEEEKRKAEEENSAF